MRVAAESDVIARQAHLRASNRTSVISQTMLVSSQSSISTQHLVCNTQPRTQRSTLLSSCSTHDGILVQLISMHRSAACSEVNKGDPCST